MLATTYCYNLVFWWPLPNLSVKPITPMLNEVLFDLLKKVSGELRENQEAKTFFDDFLTASVRWVRPLFLKDDDTPADATQTLAKATVTDAKLREMATELAARVAPTDGEVKDLQTFLKDRPAAGSKQYTLRDNTKFVNDSTIEGDVNFS